MKSCIVRPDLVLDFDFQKPRGRQIETYGLWEISGLPSSSRNRSSACRRRSVCQLDVLVLVRSLNHIRR